MNSKDNVRSKTGEFLSNSLEMFEKIFAQATRELRIRKKLKPADQEPSPAPAPGTSRLSEEKAKVVKRPEKKGFPPKQPDKVKAGPAHGPKTKPRPRAGGGSRLLKASLLVVLLLSIAGFLANYFSIVDFTAIPDLLGLGPKPVVQAPIPRKQPAKPPQKPLTPPKPSQPQAKVPALPPTPSEPTSPAVSKEERLVEIETPTTMAQTKPLKEQAEGKALSPSTLSSDQPKSPETAAAPQPKPVPAQTQTPAKPAAPQVASSPPAPQYPYSVYLGSFKAPEAVKRALSDYQEKGLSVYWARVNLGDKGVWFRFFAGYFRTKEETEKYIKDHNIQGATPGITKYANFLGSYGSDKQVEDQKRAIVSAGFYPYVIKAPDGRSLVYSGAFDRKEYAEKERALLASKGFRSEVVER